MQVSKYELNEILDKYELIKLSDILMYMKNVRFNYYGVIEDLDVVALGQLARNCRDGEFFECWSGDTVVLEKMFKKIERSVLYT